MASYATSTKTGMVSLILDSISIFKPEIQLWLFLRMRNSKLGKNSRSEDVVHLPNYVQKETNHVMMYNFANEGVE